MNRKTTKSCAMCGDEFKLYKTTDKFCSYGCASKDKAGDRQTPIRSQIKPISDKRRKRLSGRSEWDVFLEIWEERPHKSELTDAPLKYGPNNPKEFVKQFLHVLPKGTYPSLRLDKDNILLGTFEEHEHQDNYKVFNDRKEKLRLKVYMR